MKEETADRSAGSQKLALVLLEAVREIKIEDSNLSADRKN
jgi:hypothetical protein